MSNRVYIEPTEFISVRTGQKSYGYRAFDSYTATYNTGLSSIPDDDMEFLKLVFEMGMDDALSEMFDYVRESQKSIYIGNTLYEYDEVKKVIG